MTVAEMETCYPHEWVLIADPVTGPGPVILGGRVMAHGPNYEDLERQSVRLAGNGNALLYMGVPESDLPLVL